jgi:uncharacterized protein with FMN-binding domain
LLLTASATALLFSFKTPSEMFASGPVGNLTADIGTLTHDPLTTDPVGLPGSSGSTSAPATLPPATEPPATVAPPTEAPVTPPPTTEPPAEQVITGQVVRTPYGPVQVEVTVGLTGMIDVQALQLPYDRSYSARISRAVEPMLRDEALQAQSANINLISGATYTSTGYAMSLQSALDQAIAPVNAPA